MFFFINYRSFLINLNLTGKFFFSVLSLDKAFYGWIRSVIATPLLMTPILLIFERSLNSNPGSCRTSLVRYQLSYSYISNNAFNIFTFFC
jgi:hypothetical protein